MYIRVLAFIYIIFACACHKNFLCFITCFLYIIFVVLSNIAVIGFLAQDVFQRNSAVNCIELLE
jgi:hypothetical protein